MSTKLPSFKENYKLIATDLSKQQTLDVDLKAIQQINFIGNLEWYGNKAIYSSRVGKKNIFGFSTRICEGIIN